ncbi:hypothetical protein B0H11DRAFT_2288936 [Mycena galericulata]|nr:hypothetical protein B0H11DRAFT_2288936 [Mycena galericulata]
MSDLQSAGISALVSLFPDVLVRLIALLITVVATGMLIASPQTHLKSLDQTLASTVQLVNSWEEEGLRLHLQRVRLFQARLSASALRVRAHELNSKTWKEYPAALLAVHRAIFDCKRNARDIHINILCAVEFDVQRKLRAALQEEHAFFAVATRHSVPLGRNAGFV